MESELTYKMSPLKTVHRVMRIDPLLVEYTDRDGSIETKVVFKAGDQMVFVDQNAVSTNVYPWFSKGVKKILGEE